MTKAAFSRMVITTGMALGLILPAYPAAAQSAPDPINPTGPIAPRPGQEIQKPPAIRVKVDMVNAPVVVHDPQGKLVLNLTERDFHVFDNGIEQKIDGFEMGGAPVSVAIVVETSSRIEALLPGIRRTGILFTQTVLGESGDAAVIGFDDQ